MSLCGFRLGMSKEGDGEQERVLVSGSWESGWWKRPKWHYRDRIIKEMYQRQRVDNYFLKVQLNECWRGHAGSVCGRFKSQDA